MEQSNQKVARIGMVKYLNTAPIHEKWITSVQRDDWQLVEEAPSVLCKKLDEGTIDLGFVSSIEYGKHPEKYKILSGLSISANGPVASVVLLSHVPLNQLDGADLLLTSQSETSVQLVKIILEEFHKVTPKYHTGDILEAGKDKFKAILAIGDDALRLVESATYLYQFDLGDIWKRQTGLPFVYAVCAVREDFCESHPEMLADIHRELLRCRDEGVADLEAICEISAARIPLSKKKCRDYLLAIQYDLSPQKCKALEAFFQFLIKRKTIQEKALPLKMFANLS
ncbi:menaquinone biosynthetic enzyme MqnA/MqnD family protein [Desulforhopalus sp. IMCC35007]|uniref:menaquinone biosynthetic enzyme MqnA/MqnD family protein n=1 Tax=Desulforhopalus sp. IMCC35007 TaxID=2569543 RepID=UPI0010AE2259|nr:menaquinone biosynthesis protein [Desulforhopalus sp. IMCC35007]TKB11239.1 ABC transporter substrate-binding protein [Desulforhopalus sp. IMCC35007]